MKIVFGADDENECTRAVIDHLASTAELDVLQSDKWQEFAQKVGSAVANGDADYVGVARGTRTPRRLRQRLSGKLGGRDLHIERSQLVSRSEG